MADYIVSTKQDLPLLPQLIQRRRGKKGKN